MYGIERKIIEFEPGQMHGFLGWYTKLECGHLRFVMRRTSVSLPKTANCSQCTFNEAALKHDDNLSTVSNAAIENGGNKPTSSKTPGNTTKNPTFQVINSKGKAPTIKVGTPTITRTK